MDRDKEAKSAYLKAITGRTAKARIDRGMTQAEMALALGVSPESYQKYETRTPLPHHLVEDFCNLTATDIFFLITGRHRPRVGVHHKAG